ncbi:TIR domain-containing protein [Flavobacterium psychrophilum]|nr:TIR domain-containing protein [Flavobacterium psychrophilum]
MGHKCFISFKTEDSAYKKHIQDHLDIDMIDKSLDEAINSDNEDYIMRQIRENYLSKSTVTIHLIGTKSAESLGWEEQKFIKRELQASLYHGEGNTQNGILGVVLPSAQPLVYKASYTCSNCGKSHNHIDVKSTTISEFSHNYYIPNADKCSWSEDDRFCVLVKWEDFVKEPEKYIDKAFQKREHAIAEKTRVRP